MPPETTPLVPFTDEARAALARIRDIAVDGFGNGGMVAVSRYLARDFRNELRRAEEAIADALPALTPDDFRKLANGDSAVRGEIERFRDARWSLVDVTELKDADEDSGEETWTILRGSSRFEVREVPRYAAIEAKRGDGTSLGWEVVDTESQLSVDPEDIPEDIVRDVMHGADPSSNALTEQGCRALADAWNKRDGETCYVVWDTNSDTDARNGGGGYSASLEDCGHEDYDATDESEAREACEAANVEDYRANSYGWPFAHNYAAAIDEREADDFAAAGFIVARHEPSGQVYAGIDGGGYDFIEAHWSRVYLQYTILADYDGKPLHGKVYVPTNDGLRRVVRGE